MFTAPDVLAIRSLVLLVPFHITVGGHLGPFTLLLGDGHLGPHHVRGGRELSDRWAESNYPIIGRDELVR